MSDVPDETPTYRIVTNERRFAIDELDEVTLAVAVTSDDGEPIPAGSTGTVVAVWGAGEAYEVEFDLPFHTLATVVQTAISGSRQAK